MRSWVVAVAASLIFVPAAFAQRPNYEKAARDAMAKLDFLVGHWEGEAQMDGRPDMVHVETVESRLDGLVLVVEGIGRAQEDGALVHHALGVISYDARAQHYRVVAYRDDGESVDAIATFLPDRAFQWTFDTTGQRSVRYTIRLSESGDWLETGEIARDGKTWLSFYQATLSRVQE